MKTTNLSVLGKILFILLAVSWVLTLFQKWFWKTTKFHLMEKFPVFLSGDGNSLSVGLVGHEKLATEIRVRTCLEMVLNRHAYYDGPNAKKNERLLEVTDSYAEACTAASRKGAFSSALTMLAVATVLGCPIQSMFPPRNGLLDKAFRYLNETFTPVSSKSKFNPISIMWTSASYSYHKTIFLPNHFVPLIATKKQSIIVI